MTSDANPTRSADQRAADAERLATLAGALAAAVDAAVSGWIERLVLERVTAWRGEAGPDVARRAAAAGAAARAEVAPRMRELLATDIDHQRTNPLSLLREVTHHAHEVLEDLGVPPVSRDEFAQRSFPDDRFGLVPATWQDIDPSLHEAGISWSAAKAYVFKARRRDEGRS